MKWRGTSHEETSAWMEASTWEIHLRRSKAIIQRHVPMIQGEKRGNQNKSTKTVRIARRTKHRSRYYREGSKKIGKKTYERNHSNGLRNVGKFRKSRASIKGIPTTPQTIKMIITTWNIRGLNSRGKQRYFKERLKRDKPNIMVVQETKISE